MTEGRVAAKTLATSVRSADPMSEPQPKEATTTARRPRRNVPSGATNVKIQTGPDLKKWAPWIAAAVTVAVVALLVRTPRFAAPGALAGALIVMGLIGYSCIGYRISLNADDKLRALILPATVGILLGAAVPLAWAIYPPAPKGTAALRQVGQSVAIDLAGGVDLWTTIAGTMAPSTPGTADYTVIASLGAQSERVAGRLHPQDGALIERRNLSIRGPGTLRLELRGISSALQPPLTLTVYARPVPILWLGALFTLLALLAVGIDVSLWKRGIEPSYAAALCLPLAAAMYLQARPVGGADLPSDVLAAGIFGAVAGGLGGELLARIGRAVAK
jgi:hypothetical protein